jgi:hypothetical protein
MHSDASYVGQNATVMEQPVGLMDVLTIQFDWHKYVHYYYYY